VEVDAVGEALVGDGDFLDAGVDPFALGQQHVEDGSLADLVVLHRHVVGGSVLLLHRHQVVVALLELFLLRQGVFHLSVGAQHDAFVVGDGRFLVGVGHGDVGVDLAVVDDRHEDVAQEFDDGVFQMVVAGAEGEAEAGEFQQLHRLFVVEGRSDPLAGRHDVGAAVEQVGGNARGGFGRNLRQSLGLDGVGGVSAHQRLQGPGVVVPENFEAFEKLLRLGGHRRDDVNGALGPGADGFTLFDDLEHLLLQSHHFVHEVVELFVGVDAEPRLGGHPGQGLAGESEVGGHRPQRLFIGSDQVLQPAPDIGFPTHRTDELALVAAGPVDIGEAPHDIDTGIEARLAQPHQRGGPLDATCRDAKVGVVFLRLFHQLREHRVVKALHPVVGHRGRFVRRLEIGDLRRLLRQRLRRFRHTRHIVGAPAHQNGHRSHRNHPFTRRQTLHPISLRKF